MLYATQNTKVNQSYVWACWNRTWTKKTAQDFFALLQWTLRALWLGTYPEKDWRGIEYPAGSKERDKAGKELANGWRAVVCALSGDMDFYRICLGLPNHNSNEPCALQAGVRKAWCVCGPYILYTVYTALQVHQNRTYNLAQLFRPCSLEGYTVETGILDGMDETYKMQAIPERIDSLSCAL